MVLGNGFLVQLPDHVLTLSPLSPLFLFPSLLLLWAGTMALFSHKLSAVSIFHGSFVWFVDVQLSSLQLQIIFLGVQSDLIFI